MKTIIKPRAEFNTITLRNDVYHCQDNLTNPKIGFDIKLYQKLFLVLLSLFIFLIFPESPKNSQDICYKNNSVKACNIW